MTRPETKVENISYSSKNQQLELLPYELSKKCLLKVICYSCLELASSVQNWLSVRCPRPMYGLDCEKQKSTCDNFGAVYSSYVHGKQLYETILDCKMLI